MKSHALIKLSLLVFSLANCSVGYSVTFRDCTILSRHVSTTGEVSKIYDCYEHVIRLLGAWDMKPDRTGVPYYREFGEYWLGEKSDFGAVAASAITRVFHNCKSVFGSESNYAGYMSVRIAYKCDEDEVKLEGKWDEEYQGHWNYTLQLGEVTMQPQWVDDVQKMINFSTFQKYCKTKYGYRLCGWVDEPRVNHGNPPLFKREN